MSEGLIHIYTGNGKGKTTAALGITVRAAGWGQKVLLVQFLKGRLSGEVNLLQGIPGITLLRAEKIEKFSWDMDEEERRITRDRHDKLLDTVRVQLSASAFDLLILDEALGACSVELLSEEALLSFLCDKPQALEVVLTGRAPSEKLLDMADYVTEMCMIKHPYDKGVTARKGVEY